MKPERKPEVHAAGGVYESGLEVEGPPRKYESRRSLKELFMQDQKPESEIYRRLIKLWPAISEARFREILTTVDRECLNKVLTLCELTGKHPEHFEPFLARDLDYKMIMQLDAIYRYYSYVLPKVEPLLDKLDESLSTSWNFGIDEKKYEARLYFLLDDKQLPLELFADRLNRPVIGSRYETWPCFRVIEARLNALKEICLTSREAIMELYYLHERYMDLKNSFYRFDPLAFGVSFPVKYAKSVGHVKKKYIYANVFSIGCAFCPQRKHEVMLIALLQERKGAGEVEV